MAQYLKEIVPPVLACFTDQDARVRYYACESMYNIAKVAKGEILLFFNDVFDALCKVRSMSSTKRQQLKVRSLPQTPSSLLRTAPSYSIGSSKILSLNRPRPTSLSYTIPRRALLKMIV